MSFLFVRIIRRLLSLIALAFLLCAAGAAPIPWPHELGDVPPDPAIRWGRLENGLRYAVRKNTEPAGRVYLILRVAAGSLHERDDQRGYAHFVEHMMFRGTAKYPATSIVNFLQHEGLEMGADTSAFTNHTTTFYNLDLPNNSREKIALGLSILRDFTDGALIARAEVKREAKVIESERRTRDSSTSRVSEELTAFLHPGTLVTRRPPIGMRESVESATADRLLEFYHTWYRPTRMTVIAVGDAEPELLETLIREQFSSLKAGTPAEPAEPDFGFDIPLPGDLQARFFTTPSPAGTSVLLYSLANVASRPDTVAQRREQLAENAGFAILSTRLAELSRQRSAEIGDCGASCIIEFGRQRQALVQVDTRADLWRAGVRLAEQELRRILLHGFTADEVKLVAQSYLNSLDENVRTESNRPSQQIAHAIRSGLEFNFVNSLPVTDREIITPAIKELTPEGCAEAFRRLWSAPNRRLAVIGHYAVPLTTKELLAAYEESAYATFFSGKDERAIGTFDYTDFGPPGTIASRRHDEHADIHSLAFANGVRLNLKRTDYEKNHVYFRLRLGRGQSSEPADRPGLGLIADGSYLAGGLGRYDNLELGRRLAGDSLSFNFNIEEDGFYFTGYASPDKLDKLLQLVTAFITDPAFRPEGWQSTIARLQSYYPTVNREPVQFLRSVCPTIMAGGDARYGLPVPGLVQQRQPAEVEEWLRPVLASGAIEIGLAGDLEVDVAIAAVARTLGALPIRKADPKPDSTRHPSLPTKPIRQVWRLEGCEPDKAAVRVYWPGVDGDDYRTSRKLQVLAEILNDRLRVKIREELGATYGPLQDVWGSEVWPGFGYFYVEIETAPKMAERVATLTREIAANIAAKGITPDEFQRVIEPRLANLKQELRNNGYWIHHVLARMQETPSRVEWPLSRNNDYQTMRREDIEEVARRFLGGSRIYTFIARPK
jgi:zinc protease